MQLAASLALAAALAVACASPRSTPPKAAAPTPANAASEPRSTAPWPETFRREAVLAARRVEVVGPVGLLDHLAIRVDPDNHDHVENATEQGLRIVERQRAESDGSPIRAQLDAVVLVVDEELVILESPATQQVSVRAEGDVYLRYVDSGEERRARSLRLEGGP